MNSRRVIRFICHICAPYWFLLPALAIYIAFMTYPLIDSFVISLHKWDGLSSDWTFIGFKNYIRFFKDPISLSALKNNLIWIVFILAIPISLGLTLASILNRKITGRTIFRSIFYSPAVFPLVSVGIIWVWIYNPTFGALNEFLRIIRLSSLTHGWLAERQTALYCVIITAIWQSTGFSMILFLAGLQGIPKELYEAAQLDGAGSFKCFRYITIPLLQEMFIIVACLLIATSLKIFDLVYIMTWGGPARSTQVLATWMYFNTFLYHNAGYGSAIAFIMACIVLLITYPYVRLMSRR
ncbi:MAG: ABC transporter permease subunit [Clostridia bacterium]|nr:ABC transporter permease subunit [Clostridia bacterium]